MVFMSCALVYNVVTKSLSMNVKACNLFSAQSLYKLISLLFPLSIAIIPELLTTIAKTLVIHSLDTVDNAEKKLEVVQTNLP